MVRLFGVAFAAALAAMGVAEGISYIGSARANDAPAALAASVRPIPAVSSTAASIRKAADGHYWTEAMVGDKAIRFLVDTGATAVALTPEDALRLGYPQSGLEYTYQVQTAGGPARAARIELDSVSVSGVRVNGVEAYVIEHGLDASLLGMSYLGRLDRFEATQSALILRP
jgi:aspartyl protease family protein